MWITMATVYVPTSFRSLYLISTGRSANNLCRAFAPFGTNPLENQECSSLCTKRGRSILQTGYSSISIFNIHSPRSKLIPKCGFSTSTRALYSTTDNASSKCKPATSQSMDDDNILPSQKLGIIARFKEMYKRYWYVLVPVHILTSTCWMVAFYYLSKRFFLLFFYFF